MRQAPSRLTVRCKRQRAGHPSAAELSAGGAALARCCSLAFSPSALELGGVRHVPTGPIPMTISVPPNPLLSNLLTQHIIATRSGLSNPPRLNPMATLEAIIAGMRSILPEAHYYALTITAPPEGGLTWSAYTHWVGWADEEQRHELRAASLVRATKVAEIWEQGGESYLVVNNSTQLFVFLQLGGNALVEQKTADEHLPEVVGPSPAVRSGPLGFRGLGSVAKAEFNRAPTPKQRMRILKRDDYRCRICGRRSADYVDIELHVHHIRPWSRGGLTEDVNLITLCHTCHRGLDPHEEYTLFSLLEPSTWEQRQQQKIRKYHEDVQRYREKVQGISDSPP